MFWWLNYKWIRNICREFPLGLAKHMLDAVLSGILERWFLVFIGSNEASLSQLPFRLWPRGRRQSSRSLCSYVRRSLHKCRMDFTEKLQSTGCRSIYYIATCAALLAFWIYKWRASAQTWVTSKNRSSPWVKSFLLTCSYSRLKVSLQLQALRSGECLKACHSSGDSPSTWPERMVTFFLDIFKEHFRKKET